MDTKEVRVLFDGLATDWKSFKEENDKRLSALEDNKGVAELEEKLAKIDESINKAIKTRDEFEASEKVMAEKVERLERRIATLDAGNVKLEREDLREYREKWNQWIRSSVEFGGKQGDPALFNELRKLEKSIPEFKAFSTATDAAGGVAVPEIIGSEIHDQVRLISPFRDMVRFRVVGSSDYKENINVHGENSAWVGEGSSRSGTNTPTFRQRAPTKGTLYAYPSASEESLQDMAFDVSALIREVTADEFAIQEEAAFLTGNGTNKPTGILNGTPVTTDDDASPQRSAEVIEYLPIGKNSPVSAIDPDGLMDMVYGLRKPYRAGASWCMNSTTTGQVRKIKDSQLAYIWQPGLQAGEPDRLMGYPHRTLEQMSDPSLGVYPVLFGNYRAGYLFIVIAALRITVDDNITAPGFVKWYLRERVGGILFDNNAIKAGKYDDN